MANVKSLLSKLAAEETRARSRDFIAPAIGRGRIRVRLGGVVCDLTTVPETLVGWSVFQTKDFRTANFVREATLAQRDRYLDLFPKIQLIVSNRATGRVRGVAAGSGDKRFRLDGEIPIQLAEEIRVFDTVVCRFDGSACWFERIDINVDPMIGELLRNSLEDRVQPSDIGHRGLTPFQRAAYELNFVRRYEPRAATFSLVERRNQRAVERDHVGDELRSALSHAGATLVDYVEHRDGYRVQFSVDGMNYNSSIAKNDLTVQVAGICLDGEDAKFDLESLVGVLRHSPWH